MSHARWRGNARLALDDEKNFDLKILLLAMSSQRRNESVQTLGDLLYAEPKVRVPETDWTRLVASIAAGDQEALQELYARAHRAVFTSIMRITRNHQTAEEVTLDVFHDIWRKASTYDASNGSVLGWIMNQARSRAIDRMRFEHRQTRQPTPYAEQSGVHAVEEETADVREALSVLTPDERQAIETTFFSELTYVEAAQRLEQPVGTVKTRIRSALEKLRKTVRR